MIEWISQNIPTLSALGASVAFIISVAQFLLVRKREQRVHEFESYHRLIKELVQPDPESKSTWIDRQVAVVYELRHFPRYYPVSHRILKNLQRKFFSDPNFQWPYLLDEIGLTLSHIEKKSPNHSLQARRP
jgi:hypothetical protein